MSHPIPEHITEKALARKPKGKAAKDQRLGHTAVDEIPSSGKKLYRLETFNPGEPNGPRYTVVLNEAGEEVDLDALAEREGKDFFTPKPFEPDPVPPLAAPGASISISPTENNLTLNPGDTFEETITVKVPGSSGATKIDVYFLADTTASMGGIWRPSKPGPTTSSPP